MFCKFTISNKESINQGGEHGKEKTFCGLGCGGNVATGKQYAEFCINEIGNLFNDTDVAILISCFGGGCGTGATPVIAQMLKNKGVKTKISSLVNCRNCFLSCIIDSFDLDLLHSDKKN